MMGRQFLFFLVLLAIPALTTQMCADGYHESDGRCFYISDVERSFGDAIVDCQSRGGELAVIDTEEDRDAAMAGVNRVVPYWINRESEDLDYISDAEDLNCYICEAPICPVANYVIFNGVCYKAFAERKTYDEARQICAADGGLLAMPRDSATNTFIHELGGGEILWIGLNDRNNENQWLFEDGQNLASAGYNNWSPGEPNDFHGGEDCAVVYDTGHVWVDVQCSLTRGFVCQLV
ncbi:C-type lectin-like [Branchiostoma floridae x Branchiostoma japonicum]